MRGCSVLHYAGTEELSPIANFPGSFHHLRRRERCPPLILPRYLDLARCDAVAILSELGIRRHECSGAAVALAVPLLFEADIYLLSLCIICRASQSLLLLSI
jgi:hypothetical protein